jgi:hypothetical protein
MNTQTNCFGQKNQGNLNFKQTKLVGNDENYIKINQINKFLNENESLSHREFGKVLPYSLNENVNPNLNTNKIQENKENIPKTIVIDHKNVGLFIKINY